MEGIKNMAYLNENYLNVKESYLFSDIVNTAFGGIRRLRGDTLHLVLQHITYRSLSAR